MTHLAAPHNLPLQLTSFIGREQEVADVIGALRSANLLTLTGTGGSGKTRLAIEVACHSLDLYPDGVWMVELAALDDPALVAPAVASTLGLRDQPERPLLDTISKHLESRTTLLLLDNCEHLVRSCASLARTLLVSCPHLTILATSRQPLGVSGETSWRIPALSFPDPHNPPAFATFSRYEAVRLFVERARARSDFSLTGNNAPHIAQLCYHLDGLPLAIELAAARTGQMPVEEIVERLDERLRSLSGGTPRELPRHQTLRAAIDSSYDLLSEPARKLLRALSVFSGSFTLEAVEGICMEEGDEYQSVDLLSELADFSLLVAEERSGEMRYHLLETIRHYATQRAQSEDDLAALRERHLASYLELAERARPELQGPKQTAWFDRLGAEHDNLRAALGYSQSDHNDKARVILSARLARALSWFWFVRGHWSEARRWLEGVLQHGAELPPLLRAELLYGVALPVRGQGEYDHAITLFTEALTLYRELGDRKYVSATLNHLGIAYVNSGDYARGTEALEEAIAIRETMGDKRGVAISLNNLANVAYDRGDYEQARGYYAECVEIHRNTEDDFRLAVALNNLGNVLRCLGDYDEAEKLVRESLKIKEELDDKVEIGSSYHKLAEIAWCRRDYEAASQHAQKGLAVLEGTGDREATALVYNVLGEIARSGADYDGARAWYEKALATSREKWVTTDTLYNLGHLALIEKEYEQASSYFRDSLRAYAQIGGKRGIAECLIGIAKLAEGAGLAEQAATLFGAAGALLEATGYKLHSDDRHNLERSEAAVRAKLGKAPWQAARREGHAMSPETATQLGMTLLETTQLQPVKRKRTPRQKHPYNLTRREVEVLRLVAEGLSDAQIGERLLLSPNTVHAHLHSIFGKLDVPSRAAAARLAVDEGLT